MKASYASEPDFSGYSDEQRRDPFNYESRIDEEYGNYRFAFAVNLMYERVAFVGAWSQDAEKIRKQKYAYDEIAELANDQKRSLGQRFEIWSDYIKMIKDDGKMTRGEPLNGACLAEGSEAERIRQSNFFISYESWIHTLRNGFEVRFKLSLDKAYVVYPLGSYTNMRDAGIAKRTFDAFAEDVRKKEFSEQRAAWCAIAVQIKGREDESFLFRGIFGG